MKSLILIGTYVATVIGVSLWLVAAQDQGPLPLVAQPLLSVAQPLVFPLPTQHGPEPAEGWFCQSPAHGVDPAHVCTCDQQCEQNRAEDPTCRSWCYRDHCHCKVKCRQT